MDKIKKDWQTDLYENLARKSPQIVPLFKYLYLAIIVFLIFEPRGLAHRWGMIKAYCKLWPFSHEE